MNKQFLIPIISLALLVTSCGRVEPVPVDHYYRLSVSSAGSTSGHLTEESLHVNDFLADGLFNERAMIYSDDGQGNELKQYHYHFWATSPPDMLRDLLVRYLRKKEAAPTVIADSGIYHNSLRISGRLTDFSEQRQGDGRVSKVSIELRVDELGNYRPLLVREYTQAVPVDGKNMKDVVQAYNSAVGAAYSDFLGDLRDSLSR